MSMPITWRRPSLALRAIEKAFGRRLDSDMPSHWGVGELQKLTYLFEVVSNVDERILFARFSPEEGLDWRRHLATMRAAVRRWESGTNDGVFYVQTFVDLTRLLERCPDEIVPPAQARLTFIFPKKLRWNIARDCASLDALILDEEWKAATVIGGSVVEALLLAALSKRKGAKAKAAEATHIANKDPGWSKVQPLDKWDLWKLISVANELKLIDAKVAKICDGARDFRNLIHAGRERAEAPCDKGTALAAAAAVENLLAVFSGGRP